MKRTIYFLVVTLIVVNVFLLILIYNQKRVYNRYEKALQSVTSINNFLLNKSKLEINTNNRTINSDLTLVNLTGDTLRIESILDKQKLVLRYSVLNCDACVKAQLKQIEAIFSNNDFDNIILFAYYERVRDLISFARNNSSNIPIYICSNNILGLSIEKQNLPYYFVIDTDLKITNTFLPHRELPELTNYYLRSLKSQLK